MIRAVALMLVLASCTKQYKVRVELTPAATDRRLASGKSDVVEGFVRGSDGTALQVEVDGRVELVPRGDVLRVDQRRAKRDVTFGTIAAVLGGAMVIGGAIAFQCADDDVPLICPFTSERNLGAGLVFLGGISIAGAGIRAVFTGRHAQGEVETMLGGGFRTKPSLVLLPAGVGLGVVVRY